LLVTVFCANTKKEAFYDSSSFKAAMTGEATIGNDTFYTYAKVDVEDQDTRPLLTVSVTVMKDKFVMADRMTLMFRTDGTDFKDAFAKGNTSPFKVDGKISPMMEATLPLDFKGCTFEYTLIEASESGLEFELKGTGKKDFQGRFKLEFVEYVNRYYLYLGGFIVLAVLQLLACRIMMAKARNDFEGYFRKMSMLGLLIDATLNSSIMYHFGVLLPIDIRTVLPQIFLMIHTSFFWMQKLVHNINHHPERRCGKVIQFICTGVMMIGGLYIPSLDDKSYSLLLAVVLPLVLQISNSFNNRVGSFTFEYNILFKLPQLLVICYIYGYPGVAAHLMPTYPGAAFKTIVCFLVLTSISYLQKVFHPRFYIKTGADVKRLQLQPKRIICQELVSENSAKVECSICLSDLNETPEDPALLTTCGHTFHETCLSHWLTKNEVCPICRREVSHPDENHFN
jgi:hypothetical protein